MNWLINPVSKKLSTLELLKSVLPASDQLVASSFTFYPAILEIVPEFYQTEKHYETLPDGSKSSAYGLSTQDIERAIAKHGIDVIYPVPSHRPQQLIWWRKFAIDHPEIHLPLSSLETLEICADKKRSYDFLSRNGFPVAPYALADANDFGTLEEILGPAPWFAKERCGGGSVNTRWVHNIGELRALPQGMILQQKLSGNEYTLNCYVDRSGKCRAVVPHQRWETIDGEVSYGITVKNPVLMQIGARLAEALPLAYGPLNFQVFHDPSKGPISEQTISFTDLNPRIGGGYPLCHAAGGEFLRYLGLEAHGEPLPASAGTWEEGVIIDRRDGNLKIVRKGFAEAAKSHAIQ
jgi:carbamoyl-phosphate synthase large subunit